MVSLLNAPPGMKLYQRLKRENRLLQGFKDEIALVVSGGKKAVAISLWDKKENAETYNSVKYPEALKATEEVIEGTPQVETCEVSNSKWYKIAAPIAA